MNVEELKREICEVFVKEKQDFGRGGFYQSFPVLGIEGQRPTDIRLLEYNVFKYVNKNSSILDIGCNVGFFDMSIASEVKSITGIEYNGSLVKIASMVAAKLNIDNVKFIEADFNEWKKHNIEKYDVIFSFAVHYWLKVTPDTYCRTLYNLLNSKGYIFFESQNIDKFDLEFETYCQGFIKLGLKIVHYGTIKDDGQIARKYFIFHKQ